MSISRLEFPTGENLKDGSWRPVFFSPNFDSPERLVAGVVAFVDGEWRLARATAVDRLRCLYGAESVIAQEAIAAGLDDLEKQILGQGNDTEFLLGVSGLALGDPSPAQAADAFELALRSLRAISSLHNQQREMMDHHIPVSYASPAAPQIDREISRDRLPVLVMEALAETAPQAQRFFNSHVHRLRQDESARLLTHKAYVAFTGQRLAANFATLRAGRQKHSVDISKRLMWDLEQHRDGEHGLLPGLAHEMILYHPAQDDPTISKRQYGHIMDVVETLELEGRNRDISVSAYESVPRIAKHILKFEGLSEA